MMMMMGSLSRCEPRGFAAPPASAPLLISSFSILLTLMILCEYNFVYSYNTYKNKRTQSFYMHLSPYYVHIL